MRPLPAIDSWEDHRLTLRYALHTPVDFTWLDEKSVRREGRGYSRDISAKGAYLITVDCPSPGATVTLTVHFPATSDGGPVLRMEAKGRVLRVEETARSWSGFAMHNERMSLRVD